MFNTLIFGLYIIIFIYVFNKNKKRSRKEKIHGAFTDRKINDSIALKTNWKHLKGGGASFATRKLVEVSRSRYEFKPTAMARLFPLLFIAIAVGVGCTAVSFFNSSFSEGLFPITFLLVPLIFVIAGVFMLRTFSKPIVFDKSRGFFWKGYKEPVLAHDERQKNKVIPFREIHALQIIKERISGKNGSYYSYELNLVLQNSKRVNVIDHGNLNKIRKDAQKLSIFLGVPVWDVIQKS
ncbi:MAG: hypothetical protein KAR24_00365 [Candidatus Pacebacteria bacterium]|nr:hypothetical protein [Candidatus Paceibacterota bacterium]